MGDVGEGDAATVAAQAFGAAPGWVKSLLAVRNLLVAPFGLKSGRETAPGQARIGFFPVISSAADRVVLGMDDRHLDFRLVVETAPVTGQGTTATATTLVRTRNLGGRLYLWAIMPFHRAIVPAMLSRARRDV